MYSVSLVLRQSSLSLAFVFKAFKNADDLYRKASDIFSHVLPVPDVLDVEDDFGSRAKIDMRDVTSIYFTDIEEDLKKNGEIQIIQTRCQLRTQTLAQNDSSLKLMNSAARLVTQ